MTFDKNFRANMIEGTNKFQNARLQAFWDEMFSLIRGKPAELMSFDDIRSRLRLSEESYKGLHNIELDKIAGSVGRYKDFTGSFLPKTSKMQERWSRVYAQANSLEGLPPIDVYKVGDVYFVRDGNHRVSVAKQIKSKTIEAHVTELLSPIVLQTNTSMEDLDAAEAYANFLQETALKRTRPNHQPLLLTEPSRYGDLKTQIEWHRSILQYTEDRAVSIGDAAAHWYDYVYRPALTLIQKYEILDNIPKRVSGDTRTEADLYLWMMDHLVEARDQYGEESSARRFSDALVDFLTHKNIAVPKNLLTEDDDTVSLTRTQVMRAINRHHENGPSSSDNVHNKRRNTA